jgi:hypothetical protein
MREVKRQTERGKRVGDELRKRTPAPLVKIRAIRVSHPCLSVCIRGLNLAFKIKSPPNNTGKTVKPNKGQLRLYGTWGGCAPDPPSWERKTPYFQAFCPSFLLKTGRFYPQKQAIYARFSMY